MAISGAKTASGHSFRETLTADTAIRRLCESGAAATVVASSRPGGPRAGGSWHHGLFHADDRRWSGLCHPRRSQVQDWSGGETPADGTASGPHQRPGLRPETIDLPGLQLLGARQEKFLNDWTQDWTGATLKCVLSQTAFCGGSHARHARRTLLADLDCNGWPQTPRNKALEIIRRAWARICVATSTWPS